MDKILVSVETVKIKDYIFATNKLKLIRGASYLLDYLNQIGIKGVLLKHGYSFAEEEIKDERIIYIGAGNAKFFCDSIITAENIKNDILKIYAEEAPGAKIVIKILEKGDKKTSQLLDEAAKQIAIEKSKGFPVLNIDLPFIEKCDFCNTNPSEYSLEDLDSLDRKGLDKNLLKKQLENLLNSPENKFCRECFQKLVYSNKIKTDEKAVGFYSVFRNKFQKEFDDYKEADTIEDYADFKSYIGFLYSDGDGLGDFLKNVKIHITDEDKYIEFVRSFSKTLDRITKDALIEAIQEMHENFPKDRDGKSYYGEFLIVGGDDVCAIFPSKIALELSQKYQEIFQKKMKDEEFEGITTSSGIVIAKSKTPAHYLFDQSLKLQKNAKKKRHEERQRTGYMDFQVIGSEGCVDIQNFRTSIGKTFQRPYSVENFKILSETIERAKKINFPKTKLRYIYDLEQNPYLEDFEKKMELISIISKMGKEHLGFILQNYGEELQISSNIFDIIEIFDFTGVKGYEN